MNIVGRVAQNVASHSKDVMNNVRVAAAVVCLVAENVALRLKDVLLEGFEKKDQRAVLPSHFCPINPWKVEAKVNPYSKKLSETGWIIDNLTGDKYQKEPTNMTRLKCAGVAASAFLVQSVALLLNAINRISKLVSLAHLWYPREEARPLTARFLEMGKDILRVALTPILFLGIQLSAIYGIVTPLNGRKLVATFERAAYTKAFIAPCFQPYSTTHLVGKYGW